MKMNFSIDRSSLVVQIVLGFLALILLMTTAFGLPAIWLFRNQLEQQTWARVDQARHATEALYAANQLRIIDLAFLTSQRPTLGQLLNQEDSGALASYLQALQQETELDFILICDPYQEPLTQRAELSDYNLCALDNNDGLHLFSAPGGNEIWMLASHAVGDSRSELGTVLVGMNLDDAFVDQMRQQTSVDHTLLSGEEPVSSSLPGGAAARDTAQRQLIGSTDETMDTTPATLLINDRPYYSTNIELSPAAITDEIALDVTDITASGRRLTWGLVGSITLVAFLGSVAGVVMARRIGQPLKQLTQAATAIGMGDLTTSLSVPSTIHEVRLVSEALEQARLDLQQSLAQLQRERDWIDHLLRAIEEGIVAVDDQGKITFFSRGAEKITGLDQAATLGQTSDDIFQLAESDQRFSHHIPPPGQQNKVELRLADGRQITLGISCARFSLSNSNGSGLVLVLRDISEAELIHRLLGGFLSNITHEFRTPLSALAASTELLMDQAPDLNTTELHELLNSHYLAIISLQTLIDNLLESASMEIGRFKVYPHPADLGDIVAEAAQLTLPLQEKYRQSLVVELPVKIPIVYADSRRIVQVLVNLLFNAIKYSPDETEITMAAKLDGDWVCITVADRGPGIPEGVIDEMFFPFMHYEPENAKSYHGAGLGLSVVKAIVEAHDGRVGVQNREGGGAAFWITLPIVKDQASL